MYNPNSLPKLPRQACPGRVRYILKKDNNEYIKVKACPGKVDMATGFCRRHAHIYQLLQLLDKIDYPGLEISRVKVYNEDDIVVEVEAGVESWEKYLLTTPAAGEYDIVFTQRQITRWRAEGKLTTYDKIITAIHLYAKESRVNLLSMVS